MNKGKTKTGFEYEIDPRRLHNYELVELLAEEETNPLVVVKIVNMLLGEQAKDLKEHIRDDDGFVSSEQMMVELKDIFESQKDVKK